MESTAEFGRLAMFPLQAAFLPGEDLPLQIFEPRYAELVRDCMRDNNPRFGVVLISQGSRGRWRRRALRCRDGGQDHRMC